MQNRLKKRRLELGLTQEKVAERAGMNRVTYTVIESGMRKNPSIETAKKIAVGLDTSLDPLFFDQ